MSRKRRDDRESDLLALANVGPAVAGYLRRVGITRVDQLAGRDPVEFYDEMCAVDGRRHDPCLLDAVMSAVEQAEGGPRRPWWEYTERRRDLLRARDRDREDLRCPPAG